MTTKFLQSALGTKNSSREFDCTVVHGNLATDQYRIHRDNSVTPDNDDPMTQRVNNCGYIPSQKRNPCTISRADLITACKRALALRDEWDRNNKRYPTLFFSINGSCTYRAQTESVGSTYGEINDGEKINDKVTSIKNGLKYHSHVSVYRHEKADKVLDFGINPRYLLDALTYMESDTVTFDPGTGRAHPVYITDGTREAVIMPISS